MTRPIPPGYHTVTPYLLLDDVSGFLEFAQKAFDAKVIEKMPGPDGQVMHAEVEIGDSRVMMGPVRPDWHAMPSFFYLYVPDADASYAKAVAAGAESMQEPKDEFYGDRTSGVRDAFGNLWWFATHVEDLSPEELERRAAATFGETA